jgi:hypothetical protein
VNPDERAFRAHLERPRVLAGIDAGMWRLVSLAWPNAVIAVAAAGGACEVGLRFTLDGYPGVAPTGAPWDLDLDEPLDPARWPRGRRVSKIFNPGWNVSALYFPMDRLALPGHDAWLTQFPGSGWDPRGDITQYLLTIHTVLNEDAVTERAA